MKTINTLEESLTLIDNLDLRHSLFINSTPKKYVILFNDDMRHTNDLDRTIKDIAREYPKLKAKDIEIINAKEIQEYYNNILNY